MNSSNTVKIVIWACNIILALLVLSFLFGTFYFMKFPALLAPQLEGVSSYRTSQTFLGDHYLFERVVDRENGTVSENYYFSSKRQLYQISTADSLTLSAKKIDRDLSSSESSFLGFITKSITVTEPAGDVPVRYAAPVISLERDQFISYARANVVHFLFFILYGAVFIWFLRKFLSGLRESGFFTHSNALYLKITAWMTIVAPVLIWFRNSVIRPDLFADYHFEHASQVPSGMGLPLLILLFGFVLLVIAWSFDHGIKLQKEQELTV